MKTKRKISPLRISPFFGPKLGEDQKKNSVPLCAQTFCPSYKDGGHAAILHTISMLIILSWRPKGGAWHHGPPKYAPGCKYTVNLVIEKCCCRYYWKKSEAPFPHSEFLSFSSKLEISELQCGKKVSIV